jgi:hypothetical protein
MTHSNSFSITIVKTSRAAVLTAALLLASIVQAGAGSVLADRFTAKTTGMTPRELTLRIDVRVWSDDAGRAAVVDALSASTDADAATALRALPTVGYVWAGDSSVGYALKYAHRSPAPSGERVTFVTDKRLGGYERKAWALDPPQPRNDPAYSVIELYLDGAGAGDGTLSLAADPKIDSDQKVVSLATDGAVPHVLVNAKQEPHPRTANGG